VAGRLSDRGLGAVSLCIRSCFAAAACEARCHSARQQDRGQNRNHQAMQADLDIVVFELDRRSVRPELDPC
jgi:hypothetical protein